MLEGMAVNNGRVNLMRCAAVVSRVELHWQVLFQLPIDLFGGAMYGEIPRP